MDRQKQSAAVDDRSFDVGQPHRDRDGLKESTPQRPEVSVVIPALNEADSIGWVLRRIPDWVSEVVLVDGLSTDQTEQVARQLRPDLVVVHQRRPGKGSALRAGFAATRGEHIVMIDADGSTDPAEMARFVDALGDGADFVKGSRYLPGGGSADLTRVRSAGNRALAQLANLLYGSRFTDLCYGYCAFRRRLLDALTLTATGFEIETQLALNAVSAGLKVHEVPSYERPRRAGVSNLNAYRDGRRVLRTLLTQRQVRAESRKNGSHIHLRPLHLPPQMHRSRPESEYERRRRDRRRLRSASSGYTGRDRRQQPRRRTDRPALVYLATEA
jgi:glycosyltransferase involved in cell wall biosynthesis